MMSGCFPFFGKTGIKPQLVVLPSAFESWDWCEDEVVYNGKISEEKKEPEEEIATVVVGRKRKEYEKPDNSAVDADVDADTATCNVKEGEEEKCSADLPSSAAAPLSSDNNKNKASSVSATVTMMADTKTHFPTFLDLDELELLSDDDEYACGNDSDDECCGADGRQLLEGLLQDKYRNKEDADVEVFLRIADRMSLTSLLHLLKGQALSKNDMEMEMFLQPPAAGPNANANAVTKKEPKQQDKQNPQRRQMFATKETKKFRWAKDSNYKILAQVHLIESINKEIKDELFWTTDEFDNIRKELSRTITIFSKFKPSYIKSLEVVSRGDEQDKTILEASMKDLTRDSYARGLEGHMIPLMKQTRTRLNTMVLRQQEICKGRGDNQDTTSDCLRKQSLLHTCVLTGFAKRMGQCDEIEALTAHMSTWKEPQPIKKE